MNSMFPEATMAEIEIISLIKTNQFKGLETLDEVIWKFATNTDEAEEIESIIDWDLIHMTVEE